MLSLVAQSSVAFAAQRGVYLYSVSCASAGNCSAVGVYSDTSGNGQGLLLNETAGAWAPGVEAILPANAGSNRYNFSGETVVRSVSCASAGSCSAVGVYPDSSGHHRGLLLTETGDVWRPGVEATLPVNAGSGEALGAEFNSVSCISAGDCTAVGDYVDSSGHQQGLLVTETGGTWTEGIEATVPADAAPDPQVSLNSVSCVSAGACSAVGLYTDSSGNRQGLLLTESGGLWAAGTEAALPANAASSKQVAALTTVSCGSTGNCSAVGAYEDKSGFAQGLLLTESGGTWARGIEATAAGSSGSVYPAWVSCASAGDCSAVGEDGSGQQALMLGETDGTWGMGITATLPTNEPDADLRAVSCASSGNCSAVGDYGLFGTDHGAFGAGLLVSESGGQWTGGVAAQMPTNSISNEGDLGGVSCAAAGDCSAIGGYGDCWGNQQAVLLSESGGAWARGVEATLPANAAPSTDGCPRVLAKLRVSPKTFTLAGRRLDGRCVKQTARNHADPACTRTIALYATFSLTNPTTVRFTLKRLVPGRRVKGRCMKPSTTTQHHEGCSRPVSLPGKMTVGGNGGDNVVLFRGRIGGRRLGPGVYRLLAAPWVNGKWGAISTATFRVVGTS